MAETGTFTVNEAPTGRPAVRILVRYDLLGHALCPDCGEQTLAVVAVDQPGSAYTRLWTNCDPCTPSDQP